MRLAFGLVLFLFATHSLQAKPPNIVVVLADDLGYGDVKSFGNERSQIETPHFDRLAKEGMRFTNAYSIASVCVPSRMSLMTGRYAFRFGPPKPGGPWGFLGLRFETDQFTLGKMLKSQGYQTGYIGKWHLGTAMTTTDGKVQGIGNVDYKKPVKIGAPQFGFNESFILPGSLDMYPYAYVRNNLWVGNVTATKGWSAFNRQGPAEQDFEDFEVLDTFADEANRFITNQKDQPFFLMVGLTAPHTPLSPTKRFEGKSRLGVYGDFVMQTDHTLGRILKSIDGTGIAENTIVIATSDHGPASYAGVNRKATFLQMKELEENGHYAAGPFRGYKFSVYEGAFRVPFVVRWPKQVAAGSHCDQIVGLVDMMATLADVTDSELTAEQKPDSISFLPLLEKSGINGNRKSIFLQGMHGNAYREGHWKLAFCPGSGTHGRWGNSPPADKAWDDALKTHGKNPKSHDDLLQAPFVQLFNLAADPGETNDLAATHPEKVRTMAKAAQKLIDRGRSTKGATIKNDREAPLFKFVPKRVWNR